MISLIHEMGLFYINTKVLIIKIHVIVISNNVYFTLSRIYKQIL